MTRCPKKPHPSKTQAQKFQRANYPGVPFCVYRCESCGQFHITTQIRPGHPILHELAEMIRAGQSEPIESPSNRVRIHRVRHAAGVYIVQYHRLKKTAWVIDREYE